MAHTVVIAERAASQLSDLYSYIAERAGERIAEAFVGGIQRRCLGLADFPHSGTRHDHVAVPGLRTIGYKRRVTIAFSVDDVRATVTVLGIFYGGQDYERDLAIDTPDD